MVNEISPYERLEAILRKERRALRTGDLGSLPKLANEKDSLISLVASGASDMARLVRLKTMADANKVLIVAALDGVRAARVRMDSIRRAAAGFDSYDSVGACRHVSLPSAGIERRA